MTISLSSSYLHKLNVECGVSIFEGGGCKGNSSVIERVDSLIVSGIINVAYDCCWTMFDKIPGHYLNTTFFNIFLVIYRFFCILAHSSITIWISCGSINDLKNLTKWFSNSLNPSSCSNLQNWSTMIKSTYTCKEYCFCSRFNPWKTALKNYFTLILLLSWRQVWYRNLKSASVWYSWNTDKK